MTTEAAEPDIAHYQQVLAGMIDLGDAVARKLAARIDDASNAEAAHLANAIQNVTRFVRRTILLSVHLHKAAKDVAAQRTTARARIIREVGDTIARAGLPPPKAETLRVELVERVESVELAPELDREIATRPIEDIILDIKRDMGLGRMPGTPPWPRRTPDDIADLLAHAKRPTNPAPLPPFRPQAPQAPQAPT